MEEPKRCGTQVETSPTDFNLDWDTLRIDRFWLSSWGDTNYKLDSSWSIRIRAAISATVLLTLLSAPACAGDQWKVGDRGTLGNTQLHSCNSYDDWTRFEIMRYRESDVEAAIKFLDEQCPTALTGPVVVEQVAPAPPDLIGRDLDISDAVCLRRIGDPGRCLWLDSSWLQRK